MNRQVKYHPLDVDVGWWWHNVWSLTKIHYVSFALHFSLLWTYLTFDRLVAVFITMKQVVWFWWICNFIIQWNGTVSPCTEEKPTSHSKRMRMLHIVAFVLFAISRIFSLINFLSQSGDRISVRYDDYNYQKTRIYDLFLNVFASNYTRCDDT